MKVLTVFNRGAASHGKDDVVVADLGVAHQRKDLDWVRVLSYLLA